jgi:ketosteroid isomerase-like protein
MAKQGAQADPATRNVEIVRGTYEALNRGDLDRLLSAFDTDIVILDEKTQVGARGCDQYRSWISSYLESWEYYREFPEELIPAGDRVVVHVRSEARGAGSGVPVVERHAEVHTLRDGRIVEVRIYPSFAEALKASGVEASAS